MFGVSNVGTRHGCLRQKVFASAMLGSNETSTTLACCTSVAAVHPPVVRRTGGFLKKRMTTIYVDSRKRVAGSDSDFAWESPCTCRATPGSPSTRSAWPTAFCPRTGAATSTGLTPRWAR